MYLLDKLKELIKGILEDNSRNWKRVVSAAAFWVILCSILLGGYFAVRFNSLKNACKDQFAAEYWGSNNVDKNFGQVAVFAKGIRTNGDFTPLKYQDEDKSLSLASVVSIRNSLQGVVDSFATGAEAKNSGLKNDGTPRGWEDCYSTFLKAPIAEINENGTYSDSIDIEVVAVGGNYTAFHPMKYLSGGFLPETAVDTKQLVINDVLAWRLYKSYDVLGETLTMWGQTFTVIGVVHVNDSGVVGKSDVNEARAYCYFSTLAEIDSNGYFNMSDGSGDGGLTGTSTNLAINCYEVILPETVKGVAYTDVIAALPNYSGNDPQMYVVRTTGRFDILKLYDFMMPIGEQSRKLQEYELPYWENAAQITIEYMFIDMCVVFIAIIALIVGIMMASLKYYSNKQKNIQL